VVKPKVSAKFGEKFIAAKALWAKKKAKKETAKNRQNFFIAKNYFYYYNTFF